MKCQVCDGDVTFDGHDNVICIACEQFDVDCSCTGIPRADQIRNVDAGGS